MNAILNVDSTDLPKRLTDPEKATEAELTVLNRLLKHKLAVKRHAITEGFEFDGRGV